MLNVVIPARLVCVWIVQPETKSYRVIDPSIKVEISKLLALLNELVHPHTRFDMTLLGYSFLPFYFQLHGEPLHVPPATPPDIVSLHGLVSNFSIFHSSTSCVTDMHEAVCRWRPLKEVPSRA